MALIHAAFFSPILVKHVAMTVLLPDAGPGPFPVYYLLHGLSDDHSTWTRNTSIERYVKDLPIAVVMPDGYRGFYRPNADGPDYESYLLDDVIGFAERVFPIRRDRAGRCIGGLSMGGYGAMRLALKHPEIFASANSHSGGLKRPGPIPEFLGEGEIRRVFGDETDPDAFDLFELARTLKSRTAAAPELLLDCGAGDFLIEANRHFHALLDRENVDHTYREFGGAHTWDYWDEHIREALDFHSQVLGIAASPGR